MGEVWKIGIEVLKYNERISREIFIYVNIEDKLYLFSKKYRS